VSCDSAGAAAAAAAAGEAAPVATELSVSQMKPESLSSVNRQLVNSLTRHSYPSRQSKGRSLSAITSPTSLEALSAIPQTPPLPSGTHIVSCCTLTCDRLELMCSV